LSLRVEDTFRALHYVDPRAAQGLETPSRTSTSHLASDPKCRPPSAQPRTQLSNLPRTENDGGNSWKRLRSSLGLAPADDDVEEYKLSAWQTAAGKLFHVTGPATVKALSPNFVMIRGTDTLVPVDERSRYHARSFIIAAACTE